MTDTGARQFDIGHTAPLRERIDPALLALALAAPPLAWMVQLLVGFAFSSILCTDVRPGVPPAPAPQWLGGLLTGVNLIALLAAGAGLAAATAMLLRTHAEHRARSGDVAEAGEGRTRFIALWGALAGGMFLLAVAFNTLSLFLVPLCQS